MKLEEQIQCVTEAEKLQKVAFQIPRGIVQSRPRGVKFLGRSLFEGVDREVRSPDRNFVELEGTAQSWWESGRSFYKQILILSGRKCQKKKHSEAIFSLEKFLAGEFHFFQDLSSRFGQQIYELHRECVSLSSVAQRGKKRSRFDRFDGHGSSRA